jgi:hypothetical protein
MKSLKWTIACIVVLASAVCASDEKSAGDAKEVFSKSAKAIQDAKVISYTIKSQPEGWLEDFVPKSDGKIVLGKPAAHDVPRFTIEATLVKRKPPEEGAEPAAEGKEQDKKPPVTETVSYKAGSDGNEYYLIDNKTKKAHHDMDPVVLGSDAQNITRLMLREFTEKEPYKAELAAEKATLEGTETLDGVECDKIVVEMPKGRPHKSIWHIARSDHLPRRVQRFYAGREPGQGESTTLTNLTDVKVDPKGAADPFKLVVPEGFTKTDEFAP